jgi:hypothetical protein
MADNEVIDLDALAPKSLVIRLSGRDIIIEPPTTVQLLKLGTLANAMSNVKGKTDEEVGNMVSEIWALLRTISKDLPEKELTLGQIKMLVAAISDAAIPPDAKELQKHGITSDTPGKDQ